MAQRGFWIIVITGLAAGCSDSASSQRDGGLDAARLDAQGVRTDSAPPLRDGAADRGVSTDAAVLGCGDGLCSAGEDCNSCERDCGACGLWTSQSAPAASDLETVFFPVNSLRGYAAGAAGTLLATSNGGLLWTSVAPTTPAVEATLRAMHFVDALQGVVVGDSGTILRTVDGGASWTTSAAGFTGALRGVAFVDALHGLAVGDGGAILRTSDGGASWGSASNSAGATLRSVAFADAQHALAVGDGGLIVRSSDGGNSWTPVITAAVATDLRAVAFGPGTSTAYAVGADGALIKSADAGLSWQRLIIDGAPDLRAVAFPVDALHGCVVGDTGIVLRTRDGGASWRRENVRGNPALRGLSFPAHWVHGYAVGRGGVIAKRQPAWDETVLYDTELAGQPRISILPGATPADRVIFAGTSAGLLFALRDFERIPLYRPVALDGAVGNRAPVGGLEGETGATIFVGTKGGFGYAVNAADGALRWRTDGDASSTGLQPLGEALAASPVVSPSRNLAFFAARGAASAASRLFAFDAKTGVCRWVFNGDCDGATGTLAVGATDAGPIHDAAARPLYLGSTRRAGGATLWAIDAGESAGGSVLWSRDLGPSSGSPAFGEASAPRVSFYFGSADGRFWRVRASDGASCWAASGTTCADASGAEEAFCTASDARAASCAAGSSVVGGPSPIFSGPSAGRVVFATADGFLRMLDGNGGLQWKSAAPIAGASAPLVLPEPTNRVYVGSSDGRLYQFNLADGAAQGSRVVGDGSAAVGSPVHAQRLYVSTTDGRIFRFDVPFAP
ncbi:MAG: PQQ-binding-like beta-propeller repeat protein [Proteobacteria bacterium]|nr:PQQ-binding-like beta-propeller repeat protein [Pseudomonadota bacterium]